MKGLVSMKAIDRSGNVLWEESEQHNLIVNTGRDMMASYLGAWANSYEPSPIEFIAFGNAPTPTSSVYATDLESPILSKEVEATPTFISPGVVKFAWILDYSEGNGYAITEMALKNTNGDMFSRIVRSIPINKTSDFRITGNWQITV